MCCRSSLCTAARKLRWRTTALPDDQRQPLFGRRRRGSFALRGGRLFFGVATPVDGSNRAERRHHYDRADPPELSGHNCGRVGRPLGGRCRGRPGAPAVHATSAAVPTASPQSSPAAAASPPSSPLQQQQRARTTAPATPFDGARGRQ